MPSKRDSKDDQILKELRERLRIAQQFWGENYRQGDADMDALSAEYGPWPAEEVRRRKDAQRPICHVDIISQFTRRIVNQIRMNPRAIVITPKGSDADDETATMREERIRQIDYESMAIPARIQAVQDAVDRGIGFYMVTTDYAGPDTFDQKIDTRQIPNPKSVLVDPYAKKPDWSDMKYAFVVDHYEYGAYREEFPDAQVRSFAEEYSAVAAGWVDEKNVQVAEYWCVKNERRKLLLLRMPEGLVKRYLDELEGAKLRNGVLNWNGTEIPVERERMSEVPVVWQYITNGLEILERRKWVGSTIPVVMVTGLRKYEDGKLVIESATRKLRAPQLLYDYATTAEQEVLGMTPKSKWVAAAGQTEDFPEWDDANRDPVAVMRYRYRTEDTGDAVLPPPERIDYEPPIQALEFARNSALIAAQQAAGMFSVERQTKEKQSGVAIDRLNTEQDVGNFHFSDYLNLAIQYEGRIKNEILRHIEDTDTMRGFRKEDDKYDRRQVTPMMDPESGELVDHPYGKGRDHDVIVKDGPSFSSQWEKASDFLEVLASNPQYAPMVMDLVVTMKQLGPMGKKLAERFEKMLPPQLQENGQGQPQLPPQFQQAFQALTEQLSAAKDELASRQAEIDAKIQMNQADNATRIAIEQIKAGQAQQAEEIAALLHRMDQALELVMQSRQMAQTATQSAEQNQLAREQMTQPEVQP